jgi:hypothetical protein
MSSCETTYASSVTPVAYSAATSPRFEASCVRTLSSRKLRLLSAFSASFRSQQQGAAQRRPASLFRSSMPKKAPKKESNEDKARRLAKRAHEDAPAHAHRLDYKTRPTITWRVQEGLTPQALSDVTSPQSHRTSRSRRIPGSAAARRPENSAREEAQETRCQKEAEEEKNTAEPFKGSAAPTARTPARPFTGMRGRAGLSTLRRFYGAFYARHCPSGTQ